MTTVALLHEISVLITMKFQQIHENIPKVLKAQRLFRRLEQIAQAGPVKRPPEKEGVHVHFAYQDDQASV